MLMIKLQYYEYLYSPGKSGSNKMKTKNKIKYNNIK